MKQFLILPALLLAFVTNAQPPEGKAKPGATYGAKVDPANALAVAELPPRLHEKDTLPVKVKGQILDVCKKKGCWMTMKVNDSTEAMVKMKDYGFFVPVDMKGKTVVLEGIAYMNTTSVAELKHYAQDAKKSQKEIDAINKPESQIRLLASGIVVAE